MINSTLDLNGALRNIDNDMDLFRELVEAYISDTPTVLQHLRSALDQSDLQKALIKAHSLKGTTRTIGGVVLGNMAAAMEQLLCSGDLKRSSELMAGVEMEFKNLVSALQSCICVQVK